MSPIARALSAAQDQWPQWFLQTVRGLTLSGVAAVAGIVYHLANDQAVMHETQMHLSDTVKENATTAKEALEKLSASIERQNDKVERKLDRITEGLSTLSQAVRDGSHDMPILHEKFPQ